VINSASLEQIVIRWHRLMTKGRSGFIGHQKSPTFFRQTMDTASETGIIVNGTRGFSRLREHNDHDSWKAIA
jgi:hypothetical protein